MPGQLARLKGALTGHRIVASSLLLTTLWWGSAAHAVGLGEIELNSALNQRFDAQIELTDVRGLQSSEIVVRLGSNEDFARVGVERFFFLTDLRFKVVQGRNGRTYLAVTSSQPISEPFLNFVVQVIWPNGRLLKEYTVLLDPPAFTDNAAPAIASPGRTDPGGGSAGRVERPAPRTGTEVALSRPAPPRSAAPTGRMNNDGTYGVTDRDDTLWTIASQSRPGGASVQQTMLAIARLNPDAFIGGNINLLKAGYVLRLPNEGEAKSLGSGEAIAAVAEHNQAWQVYRQTGTIASVGGRAAPEATEATMAGQVDATAARAAAPASRSGPEGELRIVAGDVGATGGTGAGGAQAIEALEAQLAATEEEVDRVARERDEAVSRLDQTAAQAEQTQRQVEVRDQQIAQLQAQLDALKQEQAAGGDVPATSQPASSDGGLMGLLASPLVWAAGGIVAVVLLVAGLVTARRRRAAADTTPLFETRVRERRPSAVAAAPAAAMEKPDDDEPTFADEVEEEQRPATVAEAEDDHTRAQTSDVIGEADIYIAYGRYPQALNLLLGALEEDPNRSDVRLKLLEIYADTKDTSAFDTHMAELVNRCDDDEILLDARELAGKLREEGGATDAKAAADDDLAIDDFDLDLDQPDAAPADTSATLDLDEDEPNRGRGDELGGDLGLDFDADADAEAPTTSTARTASRPAVSMESEDEDLAVAADGAQDDEFDLEDLELEVDAPRTSTANAGAKPAAGAADDAFDFLDEEDTASTKLDLARAYIDMGDEDGAREILSEVLQEGSSEQQKQANELLAQLA